HRGTTSNQQVVSSLFVFSQLQVEADSSPLWLELAIHNAPHAFALRSGARQRVSSRFRGPREERGPGVSRAVVESYQSKLDKTKTRLTPRERQVLQVIAEGKSMREIASLLGISVKTADSTGRG
ncbi:MAG: LuxR C-terminal-related transcriptional regulator, partial [Candidatus Acidiferrum sp.]